MPDDNEIRENLEDGGCDGQETESILICIHSGDMKKAEKMITEVRTKQLKEIHEKEICISRLDYLSYQIRKGAYHE
jgi:hypothetical protein